MDSCRYVYMLTSLSSGNYKNKFILMYNKQALTIIRPASSQQQNLVLNQLQLFGIIESLMITRHW
jgi:hypothetical protein